MGIHAGSKTHIGNPFCHVKPQRGKFLPKTGKHKDTGQDITPTLQAIDNAELVLLRENHSVGETALNFWSSGGCHEHFSSCLFHPATCSCILTSERGGGTRREKFRYQPLPLAFAVSFGHHSNHVLTTNFGWELIFKHCVIPMEHNSFLATGEILD